MRDGLTRLLEAHGFAAFIVGLGEQAKLGEQADHFLIDRRPATGDATNRREELVDRGHPHLQQVTHPAGAFAKQFHVRVIKTYGAE
jgi:hypothetical protein